MPKILKLPELVQQNGVSEMQIWSRWVESCFDPQGTACSQLFYQL